MACNPDINPQLPASENQRLKIAVQSWTDVLDKLLMKCNLPASAPHSQRSASLSQKPGAQVLIGSPEAVSPIPVLAAPR